MQLGYLWAIRAPLVNGLSPAEVTPALGREEKVLSNLLLSVTSVQVAFMTQMRTLQKAIHRKDLK